MHWTNGAIGLVVLVGISCRCESATITVLNQPAGGPNTTAINDRFLAVGFETGATTSVFQSCSAPIQYGMFGAPFNPIQPTLEFETRGSDGSVGATLYATRSTDWSYNGNSVTFADSSGFTFEPLTGYWLVFSDPGYAGQAGFGWAGLTGGITNYQGLDGFSIPTTKYAFASQVDNSAGDGYLDQLQPPIEPSFALVVNTVPEPNCLACFVLGATTLLARRAARSILAR